MRLATIFYSLLLLTLTLQALENPKGGVIEWTKTPDSKTGNEVWQITNHDSMSVAVYFEQQAFTSDDRYVVFASKRTAKWQIYRADLTTGEDTFLCWPNSSIKGKYGQFAHVHPSLSLSGRFACYTSTVSGIPQVYVVPIGKYTDSLNDKVKPEVLFIESD